MQLAIVRPRVQEKYSKRNHMGLHTQKKDLCHNLWQNASNLWIFDLFQRLSGWLSKSRNKWSASASIWTSTVTLPVPNSLYIANCLFTHWKDIVSLVRPKASNPAERCPEILSSTSRVTSQGDYRTHERQIFTDKDHNLPPPKLHWQLQMHWPSNLDLPKWQLSTAECSNQFHSLSKQGTFDCLIGSKYHSTSQWNAAAGAERFVFGQEHSIPRWGGKMQFSSVETSRPCNYSAGKAKLTLSKLLWRCVPKPFSILYFQAIPERTEEWKTQFTLQAGG